MQCSDKQALEIAASFVNARLATSTIRIDAAAGKSVAEFFKAIYEGVKEITDSITE